MIAFDSSRAWKDATAAIAANRDVLLAMAGFFFMLPWLAFMLLVPEAAMKSGMAPQQAMAAISTYMRQVAPYLLVLTLVETCGVLAILTLCSDRSRPTVGEAIRRGAIGVVPYVGAMLVFILAFVLVIGLAGALLSLAGPAGSALLVGLTIGLYVFGQIRMVMVAPVIAVETSHQPWRVVKRSWALTRGNVGRILLFLLLLILASQILMSVIGMLVGGGISLAAGKETGHIAEAVVTAAMLGLFQLLMTAVMAAMHDQLADPRADLFD